MADKSRIPRSAPLFNSYIVNTTNYLLAGTAPNTNAARLGVLDSEVTRWSALASKWGDVFYFIRIRNTHVLRMLKISSCPLLMIL